MVLLFCQNFVTVTRIMMAERHAASDDVDDQSFKATVELG